MSHDFRDVVELLLSLFDTQELVAFTRQYSGGQDGAFEALRGESRDRVWCEELVLHHDRRGTVDALFEALREVRPGRQDEIDRVAGKESSGELRWEWDPPERERLVHALMQQRTFESVFRRINKRLKRGQREYTWALHRGYEAWTKTRRNPASALLRRDRLVWFRVVDKNRLELLAVFELMRSEDLDVLGHLTTRIERILVARPDRLVRDAYTLAVPVRYFLPWLGGDSLVMWTIPLLPQGPREATCMSVALQLSAAVLQHQLGVPRLDRDALARIQHRTPDRPFLGLSRAQIRSVYDSIDVMPVEYLIDDSDSATPVLPSGESSASARLVRRGAFVEFLHAYVDSRLPVVLVLSRRGRVHDDRGDVVAIDETGPSYPHAVVVVGHTQYASGEQGQASEHRQHLRKALGLATTTDFVDSFVVHDSDIGPYLRLPTAGDGDAPANRKLGALFSESVEKNAIQMWVGLPPDVRMPADHVFVLVKNLLTGQTWRQRHRDVVDALPDTEEFVTAKVLNESFVVARDNDELLISVYLDHASQLRSNAAADPDYGHAEREVLYGVRLPQYVWVVEVSTLPMARESLDEPRVLGEFVFDPSMPAALDAALVFARLPGWIYNGPRDEVFPSSTGLHRTWLIRNFEKSKRQGT